MKRLSLLLILFCIVAAAPCLGQAWTPPQCNSSGFPLGCVSPITSSGGTIIVTNPFVGYNASFDEVVTGAPSVVSITVQGCSPTKACDSVVDTNTVVGEANRFVTFSKAYTSFKITATWTGGTNTQVAVYPVVTTARTGSGALVNASFDVPSPVLGNSGIFQYKIQSNGQIQRISCSTDQGTATVNIDIRAEGSPNSTGTSALTSSLVCNSNTAITTTIDNPQYLANAPLALLISALSGSPSVLRVHVASVSN